MAGRSPRGVTWGVASVLFAATGYLIEAACVEHGPYTQPRIYASACYQLGVVLGLSALTCAIVATKRGSSWWFAMVLGAGWFSLVSFFSEL